MRAMAFLMITTILLVPLAGCTGEDLGPYEDKIIILESENSQLESEINQSESENNNLNSQINNLNSQILVLTNEKLTLQLDKQLLEFQIVNFTSQISSLEFEQNSSEDHIESLEASKQVLEIQVANLITERTNLTTQISTLASEISELNETLEDAFEEGFLAGTLAATTVSTLDIIHERGSLKCGVKTSQRGMGYVDPSTGIRSGLDISYCRAIAAAIGLNPDLDVEYIPASGGNRFDLLANGDIDVLIRTTTFTKSRDTDLNAHFTATNFYDGQALIVNGDYSYGAMDTLSGLSICVVGGTTYEGNLFDYSESQGLSWTYVGVSNGAELIEKFESGECDAYTADRSALAHKWLDETDVDSVTWTAWITPDVISKEPLGAAVRDGDTEWAEVVEWVWHMMVTAEELGISSSNYQSADTSNLNVYRLLEENSYLGTSTNTLSDTWVQDVLEHVGNYGEIYSDAFCGGSDSSLLMDPEPGYCAVFRQGSLNALVSEGGIMYAPPIR